MKGGKLKLEVAATLHRRSRSRIKLVNKKYHRAAVGGRPPTPLSRVGPTKPSSKKLGRER